MENSTTHEERFHFCPANYDIRRADRQSWELEKSRALSHAARMAHWKRRKREQGSLQAASRTVQIPQVIKTGLLDPFVSLSIDLSVEDRNLLQGYLVTVPREFYGTSAASSLCPVRDVTLGVLASNQILLTWAVLFMHHRNALLRNTHPNQDTLLLRRRQETYKIISTKVTDPEGGISEDAMYGLAFSALIEHRTGDKLTAQKHLQACLTLKRLRLQKGLPVSSYPMGMLCIPVCIQVGVPQYFQSLEEVRRAGYTLKQFLWCLQEWKRGSTHDLSDMSTPSDQRSVWSIFSSRSHEVVQRQKSVLKHHLTRSLRETTVTGDRMCLAILAILSLSILTFDIRKDGAIDLLQLITRCFSESDSTSSSDKTPVTMLGMLYIIIMSVDRIQSSTADPSCAVDLWRIVEMVEFLVLAAPSSRVRVKHSLFSWILDETQNAAASDTCDDIFFKHIIEDVEVAWLSQHSCSIQTSSDDLSRGYSPAPDESNATHDSTESTKTLVESWASRVSSDSSEYQVENLGAEVLQDSEDSKDRSGW